jgi:predicted MFS family arabinose efflux permease
VFLLNVPIVALAIMGVRRLSESRDRSGPRSLADLDWPGVATIVVGLALVSIAVDDIAVEGLASPETLVPLAVGGVLLVAFMVIETRVARPLVRPSLMRSHLYVVLLVAGTIANIGSVVYVLGATLDLQEVRGLSPAVAGLAFFVSSVGLALCGPLSGRLSVRYPAGMVMGAALVLSAPALSLLALAGPLPVYIGALALCGITTGMGYALGQIAVQNVLPPDRSAEGTSVMLTMLISVGGVGVVAATAVVEALGDGRPTAAGIATTLYAIAGCLLLAGIVTLVVEARRSKAVTGHR